MPDEAVVENAKALLKAHPGRATGAALQRVQELVDAGDLEGAAFWGRVAALVSEMESGGTGGPAR